MAEGTLVGPRFPAGAQQALSGTPCERFFPLVDDAVYRYMISGSAGETGVVVARVRREGALVGELRLGAGSRRFAYRPDGVVLAQTGTYVLREPLVVGRAWQGEHGGQARIVEVGVTATVPAGQLSGCIRTAEMAEGRPGEEPMRYVSTYCPEVGLTVLEASDGEHHEKAELSSYGPPVDIGPDGVSRIQAPPP
ncbi:Hypothetical protein CAP_4910 [Chondromyces apiculatus DSM 436]|uniref:Uncharacterized protein n=1 Tax=Chondromyces apiculatus DSM 436 TaxID=1192034 RepID=A0A017T660_9BACT|nr:Hypothetical protein CAP_4910 [Chondromyces apiculatus DSM 436]